MAARPAGAVPIAPSRTEAAGGASAARPRAVASSDIVFANGQAFNGRGYRVCGVANQRGTLCGRIGTCPFHAGQTPGLGAQRVPKRRRSRAEPAAAAAAAANGTAPLGAEPAAKAARTDGGALAQPGASDAAAGGGAGPGGLLPECVRRMDTPPTKSRFKRSWTPQEHRQFLQSMKKFGKGKWKEIAREVKTRTANQCQSHAQKYFLRQAKSDAERKKKSIHDLTDDTEDPPARAPKAEDLPAPPPAEAPAPAAPNGAENGAAPAETSAEQPAPGAKAPLQLPPFLYDATDSHPGASGVNALASVALAAAGPRESLSAAGPRESLSAAFRAALTNAAATSQVASQVSAANTAKTEALAEATEDEDGGDADAEQDATAAPALAPAAAAQNVQVQALALAALAAAAMNGAAAGGDAAAAPGAAAAAPPKGGATVPVMVPMTALQGPFSQLINNPQALMYLNPLLATMGSMNRAAAPAPPAPPAPARLRVTVHKNGAKGGGMALMLPDTMLEFFELAKQRLLFDGDFVRVFTRSGGEITSLDQMMPDDALWLSRGEEFATPT